MSVAIVVTVLLLIIGATCYVPARPSVAIGLLITLYGVEQVLMAQLPVFASYSTLYNYGVGGVGVLAILIGLYRFGAPRISIAYTLLVVFFFLYTCVSGLWTEAPATARDWLTHFVAEIPLCVLIPICTLRGYADFRAPIQLVLAISTLVSVTLLTNPAYSFAGRTHLVGQATVLSPAEMTGAALVLLTSLHRDTLGAFWRLRIPAGIIMGLALYRSGARGQFLLAIALPILLYLSRRFSASLSSAAFAVLGVVVSAGMLLTLVALDVELPGMRLQERYSVESLQQGLSERSHFIRKSLSLDRPIFGHGVAGWSFMHNHTDRISKLDRSRITYPHNSLAHVYFELGLVGLIPFVALIALTLSQGRRLLRTSARDPVAYQLASGLLLYFLFSFGLSLKQNTYLAILGVYLSGSMMSALSMLPRSGFEDAAGLPGDRHRAGARKAGRHV